MNFCLIGLDYKSAPAQVRQKMYLGRRQVDSFWKGIAELDTAILVTCNRFDISLAGRTKKEIIFNLVRFREKFPEFFEYGYIRDTELKFLRYGLRLACGIESQLKGEYQILEQLRAWLSQDRLPRDLFEFWSWIIDLAAEIRLKSGLNSNESNIAALLFQDLKDLGAGGEKLELAVVGTGKLAELLAEFKPDNMQLSFVAHKNRLKAQTLASRVSGQVLSFNQFRQVIFRLDAIVSAARSPHIILKPADIPDAVLQRDKPLYVYDLGFPMNVAGELSKIKNIVLKNLDDLAQAAKNINRYFQGNLNLAEYLIEEAIISRSYSSGRCATVQGK
jgi:glutamyl-tRNA reductase